MVDVESGAVDRVGVLLQEATVVVDGVLDGVDPIVKVGKLRPEKCVIAGLRYYVVTTHVAVSRAGLQFRCAVLAFVQRYVLPCRPGKHTWEISTPAGSGSASDAQLTRSWQRAVPASTDEMPHSVTRVTECNAARFDARVLHPPS